MRASMDANMGGSSLTVFRALRRYRRRVSRSYARPPVAPPRDSAASRPALRVLILGGIIYTRENIGNVR
ncbi:hypothetical protein Tco_0524166 [Tanacetum coccineum]